MRRIFALLCIPAAIIGGLLLNGAENRFTPSWLGEAFAVALFIVGALLIALDTRARRAETEARRHRELVRTMRESKPAADPARQLARARELIQTRQYAQARLLLRTVDHPTAHRWLEKLERISE